MIKRIFSIILSIILICSFSVDAFAANNIIDESKVLVGIVDDAGLEFDQELKSGTYVEGFGYYYYFNFTLYKSSNWRPFITNNMNSSISVTNILMTYN